MRSFLSLCIMVSILSFTACSDSSTGSDNEDINEEDIESAEFYRAGNGHTIKCEDAEVGESGTVSGETYTKRTADQITPRNAENTCTSGITSMAELFKGDTSLEARIFHWDVSSVTDMNSMFKGAENFLSNLNHWDVSSVTNMKFMFDSASSFDVDLSSWNVSNVTNMLGMFYKAYSFNQDLGNWNVSSVTDMRSMFLQAESFNQDISGWCVSQIPSKPASFSTDCPLKESYHPEWGTCPS